MYPLIERYIKNMQKEDVQNFALTKDLILSAEELDFTYNFIKKNWQDILQSPSLFDIKRYQNFYSPQNFNKIQKIYNEYYQKYFSSL